MGIELDLVDRIVAGKDFDKDSALLVASGLTSESDIETYKERLDEIHQRFQTKIQDRSGLNRVLDDAQRNRRVGCSDSSPPKRA